VYLFSVIENVGGRDLGIFLNAYSCICNNHEFNRTTEIEMKFKIIVSVVLAVLALVFIFQNFMVIDIRLLFWKLSISRSLLMFLFFLIGLILGWLLHSYSIHNRKK